MNNTEYMRRYRAENRDKLLTWRREYYRKNFDIINEKRRLDKLNNPEKYRQYYENIKDKRNIARSEYRRQNIVEMNIKAKKYRDGIRMRLINVLGPKCVACAFSDIRTLQIDHINGGGRQEVKRFHNATMMYLYYLKNQEIALKNVQVLCANCNWIKIRENGEYLINHTVVRDVSEDDLLLVD